MRGLRITFARFSCIVNCSTQGETGQVAIRRKARLKYLFLPGLPKSAYGLARLDLSRPVFVLEGIIDCVTLWQWGCQAAAMLGTWIKPQDVRRLARAAKVIFVSDTDEAGEAAAARWQEAVAHGAVLRPPESVDDGH